MIEYDKVRHTHANKWKEWKSKNPDKVLACKNCNKALTIQNINSQLRFKCPHCKHLSGMPVIRKRDIVKGHSGKKKRNWKKLVDKNGKPYPVISHSEMLTILNSNIPEPEEAYKPGHYKKLLRRNASIALIYLLAARVSEVIGIKKDNKYQVFPLSRSQIAYDVVGDHKVIVIKNINILKRKEEDVFDIDGKAHKSIPKRDLKLYDDIDGDIFSHVMRYIEVMDRCKTDDYNLFPFTRQTIVNYLNEMFENYLVSKKLQKEEIKSYTAYLHWLRHSRLTCLVNDFGFQESMLRHYVGWGSSAMAKEYVHLTADDLLNLMAKKIRNSTIPIS